MPSAGGIKNNGAASCNEGPARRIPITANIDLIIGGRSVEQPRRNREVIVDVQRMSERPGAAVAGKGQVVVIVPRRKARVAAGAVVLDQAVSRVIGEACESLTALKL